MPQRRFSVLNLVLGILNILVALAPPCAGLFGTVVLLNQRTMVINGRDVGPQFNQHIDQKLTAAKPEAIGACACNGFLALLLVGGSIGLFLSQEWARWLTIGAALLLCLTLCIHDVYQLFVFRPAMNEFLDQHLPPQMPAAEREGFKVGFTGALFIWSWTNPLLMVYLLGMSITLGVVGVLRRGADEDEDKPRKRRRDRYRDRDDDDDDD